MAVSLDQKESYEAIDAFAHVHAQSHCHPGRNHFNFGPEIFGLNPLLPAEIPRLMAYIQDQYPGLKVGLRTEAQVKDQAFDGIALNQMHVPQPMGEFDIVIMTTWGEAAEITAAADIGIQPADRNKAEFVMQGVPVLTAHNEKPGNNREEESILRVRGALHEFYPGKWRQNCCRCSRI